MLEVRKPFDPSISEDEDSREIEEKREIKENEEKEEKPIESMSNTTEETHGGEESTESIQDSENPSETSTPKSEKQSSAENESNNESSGSQGAKEEAESENSANENNSSDSHEGASSENSTGEDEINEKNSDGNSHESDETNSNEASDDAENSDNTDVSGEANETEDKGDIGSLQDSNEGMDEDNEDMNSDDVQDSENDQNDTEGDEYDQDYEDQDDQAYSYNYNTEEVVNINVNEKLSARYFATEFWRFIESFAEEKTKIYTNQEAEEYNVKKLMFRQYERKPLNAYMQKRVRETVVLILDNSGSMSWWANNLKMLASLALEKKDVEIYIAPNGEITAQLMKNGRISVSHNKFMKKMNGRKIIYVGDFDGGDTPIELSWSNDVIWICPEDRYRHFLSHDWVHYDESRFHGVFIRAFTLEEMFKGLRRITRLNRLFIDLHEDERFVDDSYDD